MNNQTGKKKLKNGLILTLFILSAAIGFALLTVGVWGDAEASMFDLIDKGEKRLGTLSCPILITAQDQEQFSAKFHNPLEREIKPAVRVRVSSGHLTMIAQDDIKFQLAPDESRKLAWPVDPDDAVYGKMVLVKVYMFRNYPIPSKHDTCGIFVLDIPVLKGKQIVFGSLGLSMVGMVAGIFLWQRNNKLMTKRQEELYRAMLIMAGSLAFGLIASLLGYWLLWGRENPRRRTCSIVWKQEGPWPMCRVSPSNATTKL
ncbi:MAG: hypothetical protein ACK2T7_04320 [Anaerolineales bacterium]